MEEIEHAEPFYWNARQVLSWMVLGRPEDQSHLRFTLNMAYNAAGGDARAHAGHKRYRNAEIALLSQLQSGGLVAVGTLHGSARVAEIPKLFWANAELNADSGSAFSAERWNNLKFARPDVMRLWPVPERQFATDALNASGALDDAPGSVTEVIESRAGVAGRMTGKPKLGRKPKQREQTKKALIATFPNGIPPDISIREVHDLVSKELQSQGEWPISADTVRRAINDLKE